MEGIDPEDIIQFFRENKTYSDISIILQGRYPEVRGFSVKSIKRFCKDHGISPRISRGEVDVMVREAVSEVSQQIYKHFIPIVLYFVNIRMNIRIFISYLGGGYVWAKNDDWLHSAKAWCRHRSKQNRCFIS